MDETPGADVLDEAETPPPLSLPPADVPERGRRRGASLLSAVVAAALVGALAGGAVAYRVADFRRGASVFGNGPGPPARTDAPPGSVAAIVDSVRPSVVGIFTETVRRDVFFETVPSRGAGSGIVLDGEGHILTNSHVVAGAQKVEVLIGDARKPAQVVGRDGTSDLAVLKVASDGAGAGGLVPAPIGDSDQLRVGDRVIAVGNALALPGGPTVTEGIVSAIDRTISGDGLVLEDLIQTDAAINPGNSGGPLLDSAGRVVGINTAAIGGAQNIGFAIAINSAKAVVEQLIQTGKVTRPFLGVGLVTVTPEVFGQQGLVVSRGAYIGSVLAGSGAAGAGIQPGDVVIDADGKEIVSRDDLVRAINAHKPGERIRLTIDRFGERLRLVAVLGEQPASS